LRDSLSTKLKFLVIPLIALKVKHMIKKTIQFVIAHKNSIMWALIILILCGMPPSGLPKIKIPGIDKVVHFGLFAIFTILLITEMNDLRRQFQVKNSYRWISFAITAGYGGLIELMQLYLFTSRGAEWFDFFADTLGAGVAVLIYPMVNRLLKGYL